MFLQDAEIVEQHQRENVKTVKKQTVQQLQWQKQQDMNNRGSAERDDADLADEDDYADLGPRMPQQTAPLAPSTRVNTLRTTPSSLPSQSAQARKRTIQEVQGAGSDADENSPPPATKFRHSTPNQPSQRVRSPGTSIGIPTSHLSLPQASSPFSFDPSSSTSTTSLLPRRQSVTQNEDDPHTVPSRSASPPSATSLSHSSSIPFPLTEPPIKGSKPCIEDFKGHPVEEPLAYACEDFKAVVVSAFPYPSPIDRQDNKLVEGSWARGWERAYPGTPVPPCGVNARRVVSSLFHSAYFQLTRSQIKQRAPWMRGFVVTHLRPLIRGAYDLQRGDTEEGRQMNRYWIRKLRADCVFTCTVRVYLSRIHELIPV